MEDNGEKTEKTQEPQELCNEIRRLYFTKKIQAGSLARTTPTKKSALVIPSTAQMTNVVRDRFTVHCN